jgi:tetratricopeptide (TPR) repeat protein
MAIEGPLRELGIHDVFQLLDLSRKTGVLRVVSELRDDEGVVYFDGGRVVHARVRSKAMPIELALLHAGKISEDDLASARVKRANGRADTELVDLLVETGAVASKEIERQLRLQIESVVFELMSWREGFFSFEERAASEIGNMPEARIRVSTESLLMEGARRIDEWSRIADKVPSLGVVPALAAVRDDGQGPQLDLLPPEWEVLSMIDGTRDLRGIAAALGRGEFDVAKVVYGLVTTGVVDVRNPDHALASNGLPAAGADAAAEEAQGALARGAADDALATARTALKSEPAHVRLRLIAARALAMLRRHGDAVDELRRAAHADPLTPEVHLELGFAAVHVGDFASARASWEHFLRLAPQAAEVGRVRAAIEALTRLMHVLEAHAEAAFHG